MGRAIALVSPSSRLHQRWRYQALLLGAPRAHPPAPPHAQPGHLSYRKLGYERPPPPPRPALRQPTNPPWPRPRRHRGQHSCAAPTVPDEQPTGRRPVAPTESRFLPRRHPKAQPREVPRAAAAASEVSSMKALKKKLLCWAGGKKNKYIEMFLTPEDAFELATKELQHTAVSRILLI
ncbi:hypothetical protein DAI22_02g282800 [Oryza sativa Japonica Group]|nr:hypothetical protein DAI22_02g282800 [Oryza sativa Japonica Group]